MKKVKYLLGFVFGLGLLFNQSFGYNEYTFIDTVTPLGNYTTNSTSARYSYKFQNYGFSSNICEENSCQYSPFYDDFGYSVSYDGNVFINRLPYICDRGYCDDSKFGQYYNNSAYYLSPYTGRNYMNSYYVWSVNKNGPYGPISTYFGTNNNFGSVFLSVGDLYGNNVTKSPKYGFGKGFFDSANFIKADGITYARLFYPYINNGDDTYTNPVNGFNLTTMSGSTQTGSYAREYFYPRGTRTNYGYIVDDGTYYTKFKHFGLFQMGYSYVYLKVITSDADDISWGDLKFRTVSDAIQIALQGFGDIDYNNFNYYSATGNINLSYNGILTVPVNSYVSWTNDDGIFLFSKDAINPSRMLYEHWSCNVSNLDLLWTNTTGCVKLDGGYLTYNNSTSVLPFSGFNTTISDIYSLNSSYPLLYDLLVGDTTKDNLHGYVEFGNNNSCVYINQKERCYGFSSNLSVNIYEQFLVNPIESTGEVVNTLIDLCNNESFYLFNKNLCDGIYNNIIGNPIEIPDRPGCYIIYSIDDNGNIINWITCQDDFYNTGDYVYDTGSGFWICTNPQGCTGFGFNSGYDLNTNSGLDVAGLQSFFYNYFKSGFFFSCPFSYSFSNSTLTKFGSTKFYDTIGRDFLYPLFCFVGGFNAGRDLNIGFDSIDYFDSRILNSDDLATLYILFDIILCTGIFFFIFKIYHLIK